MHVLNYIPTPFPLPFEALSFASKVLFLEVFLVSPPMPLLAHPFLLPPLNHAPYRYLQGILACQIIGIFSGISRTRGCRYLQKGRSSELPLPFEALSFA